MKYCFYNKELKAGSGIAIKIKKLILKNYLKNENTIIVDPKEEYKHLMKLMNKKKMISYNC